MQILETLMVSIGVECSQRSLSKELYQGLARTDEFACEKLAVGEFDGQSAAEEMDCAGNVTYVSPSDL
jgi:hypothetical protein